MEIIKKNSLRRIIYALCVILLIIIILLLPLRIYIYNVKTYIKLYENNNVFSEIDREDAAKLTMAVIDLLRYGNNIHKFELNSQSSFFTTDEIAHLYDVRILIQKFLITLYVSTVLFAVFIILLIRKNVFFFIKQVSDIFLFSSCIVIFLILLLYFLSSNFIFIFDRFHHIFFPQGNWAFPEGSLLIALLPLNFFYDFFIKMLITSLIISFIFLSGSIIFNIIFRRKIKNDERLSEL